MIRSKVVPKLEKRLGRQVAVGDIDVRRGHAVLRDVVVAGAGEGSRAEPLVELERVDIDFDFWPSLVGNAEVSEVRIDGMRVRARRGPDGDNYSDVLDRLRPNGDQVAEGGSSGGSSMRPDRMVLRRGHIEMRDATTGVTVIGTGLTGKAESGGEVRFELRDLAMMSDFGPHASAEDLVVTASAGAPLETASLTVGTGEVYLWRGMTLTGVRGTIARGGEPGQLDIGFEGGYGGAEGTLWQARGWVQPGARRGSLSIDADRFTFDRISTVLGESMVRDFTDTAIDASLHFELDGDKLGYSGDIELQGLNIYHPMLAEETVRDVTLEGHIAGAYDHTARHLRLDKAEMSTRGVEYALTGQVLLPYGREPDGSVRSHRRFDARLVIPPVPCQTMLESIPAELIPHLVGFQLRGTFATDVQVAVDWSDFESTVLDGSVGIRGCKVKKAPPEMDARRFAEDFEHEVEIAPDKWETIHMSPSNLNYTPLSSVSVHLLNSFMTTEDSSFYRHRGFITREFRTALIKNLEAGYFKYGASSITMQLVKNVMLHRDKTLARKLQELFLTYYIETVLDKDRLFEIYVNAIEYGPGLYGIKPATYQYFGKHPADLNPVEAAFFSSILPAPKRRYKQFCKDKVSRWTQNKIQRILAIMHKRERLTAEELAEAQETELVFQPDKSGFCDKKYPEWGIQ